MSNRFRVHPTRVGRLNLIPTTERSHSAGEADQPPRLCHE